MLPLRIIDQEFKLLGELDQYTSLQINRSHFGVGNIDLRINRYKQHADKLLKGNIIFPENQQHKAFFIRHREIELDENGKATENWIIKALSLKSITAQRLIYPSPGSIHNSISGDAETVFKHYINTELVNHVDSNRIYENLIIAPNLHRGVIISVQSRYDNLADKLTEIATLHNIGWDIVLDIENKQFVFDVVEGMDRSVSQSIIPPATFSTEFETLKAMSYVESDLDYKNVAIVGGVGEGLERKIIEVGENIGSNRFEIFVDARNVSEEIEDEITNEKLPRPEEDILTDLINEGVATLSEHAQEVFLEGQALTNSILKYEKDHDLGDIVTLQNKDWGVTLNTRITAVKEVYEPDKFNIDLTFDNDRPTLISKIKSEMAGIKKELQK